MYTIQYLSPNEGENHLHVSDTVTVVPAHPVGTVYDRFGSLSHTVLPSDSFLKNLYWNEVPTGTVTVAYHSGFDEVYLLADRAIAELVSQLPSWLIEPLK
jgi:hypothetical protein